MFNLKLTIWDIGTRENYLYNEWINEDILKIFYVMYLIMQKKKKNEYYSTRKF